MVVDQINNELAQLDKDVGTINSWVNCHWVEINENHSQSKVTEGLVSDLVRRLEVMEERDVLREGQLQSLLEEMERLKGGAGSKGKGVDRGESLLLLREGMLTTDLEDLFAMIPRAESRLSYATPRSTLEPILSDSEEELAEPIEFQPVVGEGEPEWDEGPENEGEIFDVSLTFYRAPSWLDSNNVGRSDTPTGWRPIVFQSVKSRTRTRKQSPSLSLVPHPYRWVLRIRLVIFMRDSTTPVVVLQYVAIPTSLPWRVTAEVMLTGIPISGILTSPAVGVERSLTVWLRDLEVGVPIVNDWTDEWLDRHDNGLVDYQNED